jgi:hypothetical protein
MRREFSHGFVLLVARSMKIMILAWSRTGIVVDGVDHIQARPC